MTGTHVHLPTIVELKKQFKKLGLECFIKHYSCYDFLVGETDSMKYMEEKYEEYKKFWRVTQVGEGGTLLTC